MTSVFPPALSPYNNLSDVQSAATSRTNLSVPADSAVVHNTGNESIGGNKTFTSILTGSNSMVTSRAWSASNALHTFTSVMPVAGSRSIVISAPATDSGTDAFIIGTGNSIDFHIDAVSSLLLNSGGVAVFGQTPYVGASPIMTRGATETITGGKTFTSPPIIQDVSQASLRFNRADGTLAYLLGRSPSSDNAQAFFLYDQIIGSFVFTVDSSRFVDFLVLPRSNGKGLFAHSGAYTSALATYSTSTPSGGSDGDIWYQYV